MHASAAFATFCVALLIVAATATPWNSANDPSLFSANYVYALNKLSLHANLTTKPWSDTYWPSFQSGIAHRWQATKPHDFEYPRNSLQQLKAMSQQQIALLSPAGTICFSQHRQKENLTEWKSTEKYDIYNSRYDYPTVQAEWSRTSPSDAQWEGLCHGWAPAAQFYTQPDAVTLTNKVP